MMNIILYSTKYSIYWNNSTPMLGPACTTGNKPTSQARVFYFRTDPGLRGWEQAVQTQTDICTPVYS